MKPKHYLFTLPLILILLTIVFFPVFSSFAFGGYYNGTSSIVILILLVLGIIKESRTIMIITGIFLAYIAIVSILLMLQIPHIGFSLMAAFSLTGIFLIIFKQAILKTFTGQIDG
jgi:hypothetical protein